MQILVTSSKRSLRDLEQVPVRRSRGDPGEFLSTWSLHDFVQILGQKILWRSW